MDGGDVTDVDDPGQVTQASQLLVGRADERAAIDDASPRRRAGHRRGAPVPWSARHRQVGVGRLRDRSRIRLPCRPRGRRRVRDGIRVRSGPPTRAPAPRLHRRARRSATNGPRCGARCQTRSTLRSTRFASVSPSWVSPRRQPVRSQCSPSSTTRSGSTTSRRWCCRSWAAVSTPSASPPSSRAATSRTRWRGSRASARSPSAGCHHQRLTSC